MPGKPFQGHHKRRVATLVPDDGMDPIEPPVFHPVARQIELLCLSCGYEAPQTGLCPRPHCWGSVMEVAA